MIILQYSFEHWLHSVRVSVCVCDEEHRTRALFLTDALSLRAQPGGQQKSEFFEVELLATRDSSAAATVASKRMRCFTLFFYIILFSFFLHTTHAYFRSLAFSLLFFFFLNTHTLLFCQMADDRAIVMDIGTGMCKAGFAGDDAPRAVYKFTTFTIPLPELVTDSLGSPALWVAQSTFQ